MRRFIRHPSDIPIEYQLVPHPSAYTERLKDASLGGLAFRSQLSVDINQTISICIPSIEPKIKIRARVVWCKKTDKSYHIGVEFIDEDSAFKARMIEQICHIEEYKRAVLEQEGRQLDGAEAAMEWIERFAASFPNFEKNSTNPAKKKNH